MKKNEFKQALENINNDILYSVNATLKVEEVDWNTELIVWTDNWLVDEVFWWNVKRVFVIWIYKEDFEKILPQIKEHKKPVWFSDMLNILDEKYIFSKTVLRWKSKWEHDELTFLLDWDYVADIWLQKMNIYTITCDTEKFEKALLM